MAPVRERSEKFGSYLQEEKLLSKRLYHMLKKSAEIPPYWVFMPYLMERMIKGTVVMGGACFVCGWGRFFLLTASTMESMLLLLLHQWVGAGSQIWKL